MRIPVLLSIILAGCAGSLDLRTLTSLEGIHSFGRSSSSEDLCGSYYVSVGQAAPEACPTCDFTFDLDLSPSGSWSGEDDTCSNEPVEGLLLGFMVEEDHRSGRVSCASDRVRIKAGMLGEDFLVTGNFAQSGWGEITFPTPCEAPITLSYDIGDPYYGQSQTGLATLSVDPE